MVEFEHIDPSNYLLLPQNVKDYIGSLSEKEVYTAIGVYNNGDMICNGVKKAHLVHNILYNLKIRPGRALFLEGICINSGYLDSERVLNLEKKFMESPISQTNASYVYL